MYSFIKVAIVCLPFLSISCMENSTKAPNDTFSTFQSDSSFDFIELPEGFKINVYAEVEDARSLEYEDGVLIVGSRKNDHITVLIDRDKDYIPDTSYSIGTSMEMPNGVALQNGNLYVAEVSRIWKYSGFMNNRENPPTPELIIDDLPTERHHGWKYINFGPDGKLYVPVGAPCNICDVDLPYCSLIRFNEDGSNPDLVAKGIRNTVGFDWHPRSKKLYFTDNGRDHLGDNKPPDELNRIDKKGEHFGYPYCHGGIISDPEFGNLADCDTLKEPVQNLGPHVASLGIEFYTGSNFPDKYKNQAFIAEHGSWNRTDPIGYRITNVFLNEDGKSTSYEVFAEGWLQSNGDKLGRPVDLELLPDGSLLVSDDHSGKIYRIKYQP